MGNCCYTGTTADDRPRATYNTSTGNSYDQSHHHGNASKSSPQQQAYTVTGQSVHDPMFEGPPPPPAEPPQLEHIADREGQGVKVCMYFKKGREGSVYYMKFASAMAGVWGPTIKLGALVWNMGGPHGPCFWGFHFHMTAWPQGPWGFHFHMTAGPQGPCFWGFHFHMTAVLHSPELKWCALLFFEIDCCVICDCKSL